jgi:hypothetical protein
MTEKLVKSRTAKKGVDSARITILQFFLGNLLRLAAYPCLSASFQHLSHDRLPPNPTKSSLFTAQLLPKIISPTGEMVQRRDQDRSRAHGHEQDEGAPPSQWLTSWASR